MIKFKLPLPISINQLYLAGRGGKRYKNPAGVKWHNEAGWVAKIQKGIQKFEFITDEKIIMELTFYFKSLEKIRDTHNYHKQIADAFEDILYNNDRWVLIRDMDFLKGDRNEVDITIYKKGYG